MRYLLILTLLVTFSHFSISQLSATASSTVNTNCNGSDCTYSGPSILINELMISPTAFDGSISGAGGNGRATSISGSSVTYAGGGSGAFYPPQNSSTGGAAGTGGGGAGSYSSSGGNGTANTGGGGGGSNSPNLSGSGGSGIVIVRYPI